MCCEYVVSKSMTVMESVHQTVNLESANALTDAERPADCRPAANEAKVCWIGEKPSPYHPDHQVELLHLQAEADALLIKLQASEQQKLSKLSKTTAVTTAAAFC